MINNAGGTVSCGPTPVGGLVPDASIDCTASYTTTHQDWLNGSVKNTATASANGLTSNQASATADAVISPSLHITKQTVPVGVTYDAVNEVITYTIMLTNTGNVALDNWSITDSLISGDLNCDLATTTPLAAGGTITCHPTYTITQADLNAGKVTNKATGTGYYEGTPYSDSASAEADANQKPALGLAKSITSGSPYADGGTVGYKYVITNTGNVTLASAQYTVSDNKIDGGTAFDCGAAVALAPLDTVTCTHTYTTTHGDWLAGSVKNTAIAGANGLLTNEASAIADAVPSPSISLAKSITSGSPYADGGTIDYSYLITNTGNTTLTGDFTVIDNLTSVTCQSTPAGGLLPGGTITCTASYKTSHAQWLAASDITNTATAHVGDVKSNEDSATAVASSKSSISLVKSIANGTSPYADGDTIEYLYVITNTGNSTITGAFTVTDDVIDAVPGNSVSCDPTPAGGVAPNATIECTGSYNTTHADWVAGSVTNKATAHVGDVDSNEATATADATKATLITLAKSITSGSPYADGGTVDYKYVITNTGNTTIKGSFTVDDNLTTASCPSTPAAGVAPGGTLTCTSSYVTTHADWMAGSVTNTATAHVGDFSSNEASARAVSTNGPLLQLVKTTTTPTYKAIGDVVEFKIVLTNKGNVTVTNPVIEDPSVTNLDCGTLPSSLAPNESITCTASHVITAADMTAGKVINTAGGHATYNNSTVNADPASVTVTNSTKPVLTITADNQKRDFGKANPALTYTITGYVGGDNASVVTKKPTCTTTATLASLPGKYPITCSGAVSAKYTIVYVAGTLTVGNAVGGATATPHHSPTPPTTSTGGGSSNDAPPAPLLALLICLAFGGLGLLAVQAQRRSMRS